jgi:O-antigen/teichoic acid export membrane protein
MLTRMRIHLAYAIGGVANSFALFLLIPYLVLRLTIEDYGSWNLFEVMILFITMVAGAGLDVGLIRSYWGENADPPRPLVGTVIIGNTIWGILLFGIGIGIILGLGQFNSVQEMLPSSFTTNTLILIVLIGVFEGWFNLLIAVLRVREQAIAYVIVTFGRMLLFLLFVVIAVESGGGISGALNGRFYATVMGTAITLIILLPHFNWEWHQPMWNRVVRYGLPLLPTNLAMYMLLASDRYVLTAFTSTQIVGIYGFMYKLATTLDIVVIRPFSLDWAQRRFSIANRPDAKEAFGKIALFFLWISLTFGLLVFAGTRFIYTWVDNPDYSQGIPYIPLILLGFVAYGLSYPLNIGMILKDRTDWLPPLSWISAIVCLGLNVWWIPLFGMAGAAWSTFVAYSIFTLTLAVASQRLFPIHYPWTQILKVLGVALLAGAGVYTVDLVFQIGVWMGTTVKTLWVMGLMLAIGYPLFGQYLPVKRPTYAMGKSEG